MQLTPQEEAALAAIRDAPQAWCPDRRLLRAGHAAETLERLAMRGLLSRWDKNRWGAALNYASWSLSAWGAKHLGLVVVEAKGRPVWSTHEDNQPIIARLGRRERRLSFPDTIEAGTRRAYQRVQYVASRYWDEVTDDPGQAELLLGAPIELERPEKHGGKHQGRARTRSGK